VNTIDMTRGIYRRIYAGFITGRRICAVSLEAEAWFWRIHAAVDDFGNAIADPTILFNATIGRRLDISVDRVRGWVVELESAKLITIYEAAGETYLHIENFEDRQPAGRNGKRIQKHPIPSDGKEVNLGELGGIQNNPDVSGGDVRPHTHTHTHSHSHTQSHSDAGESEAIASIWSVYPKKSGKREGVKAIAKAIDRIRKRTDAPADPVAWLLARVHTYATSRAGQDPKFTKHAQGWFNGDRFDDVELINGAKTEKPRDYLEGIDGKEWTARGISDEEGREMMAAIEAEKMQSEEM
jgi:hypothetical protein